MILRLEDLHFDFKDMKPAMKLNGVVAPDSDLTIDQTVTALAATFLGASETIL